MDIDLIHKLDEALSNNDSSLILQFFIAMIGVLVGGVITYVSEFQHQKRRNNENDKSDLIFIGSLVTDSYSYMEHLIATLGDEDTTYIGDFIAGNIKFENVDLSRPFVCRRSKEELTKLRGCIYRCNLNFEIFKKALLDAIPKHKTDNAILAAQKKIIERFYTKIIKDDLKWMIVNFQKFHDEID